MIIKHRKRFPGMSQLYRQRKVRGERMESGGETAEEEEVEEVAEAEE